MVLNYLNAEVVVDRFPFWNITYKMKKIKINEILLIFHKEGTLKSLLASTLRQYLCGMIQHLVF